MSVERGLNRQFLVPGILLYLIPVCKNLLKTLRLSFLLGAHIVLCGNLLPRAFTLALETVISSGAPNENIVQNHLNVALLNVF